MGRVTVRTSNAAVGMFRAAPPRTRRTLVFFVALQAEFRLLCRSERFEAQYEPRLLAPGFQVATGRSMTGFAGIAPVDVVFEGLRVGLVASHAEFVVVDQLGTRDFRNRYLQTS